MREEEIEREEWWPCDRGEKGKWKGVYKKCHDGERGKKKMRISNES